MPQGQSNPEVQNADVGEETQEEEANGGIVDVDGEPEDYRRMKYLFLWRKKPRTVPYVGLVLISRSIG